MFTGLIREIGEATSNDGKEIKIKSSLKPKIGDSIAINGICLTVTAINSNGFSVEAADETRRVVPPQKLQGRVHLEPAMMMGDRFEGHIVQGHVDTVGTVSDIKSGENAVEFIISVEPKYIKYIIPKGSITVDGVSLTVNDVYEDSFRLTIIPHTVENTLFKDYKIGSRVNIETDMFARYIEHILSHRQSHKKDLKWQDVDAIQMSF